MAKGKITEIHKGGPFGGYFITFIGAAVYFVQHSVGFWGGVVGILKALVWPAFVVHSVLGLLKL